MKIDDVWPFWYRRMWARERRRTSDDMDYRAGRGQHYPVPAKFEVINEDHHH
jgi:hypothetical protein